MTAQFLELVKTDGWHIGELEGAVYYFKEGGGGGFHAEMRVYPREKLYSVVVASNTTFDVKRFLNRNDSNYLRQLAKK